jgi:hypothetical protein
MAWHSYYGNGYTAAQWPNSYREDNVDIIAQFLYGHGWTIEAIAATLGNVQIESYINPGQWQHGHPVEADPPTGVGFGLVQWTPWTKYSTWAGDDWKTNWDKQLERIIYEVDNNIQWVNRHGYTMTFKQFTQMTLEDGTLDWLTMAFFWCYEYGTPMEAQRTANAQRWYTYLQEHPPTPVEFKSKFKIMLYLKPYWKKRGVL